ncbi:TetR/AcrR family transcriptional regulator [Glutamicibacter protophormiae]|uniref:TetR/AcrR family transcriptional regulator n=1 Tax=unclassified Kocuria TaxID=2649579 RepID=UPI000F898C8E|nr:MULTISPECIES: TetR/AcrR family transcriptional regulator [unclassified Kocuria]RUP85203.1 TetR/AcrR family transcriptional regulator [Kocuria sp. HSID17590]RUQ09608.1 TetR/AcrR family transcriptional regulator [Kocuria sp. HSID17582]WNB88376.1 TetR/AcrR family transcriptional regulator [Glutamicibacter protophormiae]
MAGTPREQAKSERRRRILDAAAELFARHGYQAVSLQSIGERAGISGPGVYRHFESKQEILAELLEGVSTRLLSGGRAIRERYGDTPEALAELISFHVDFALADSALIRVHERDFGSLEQRTRHRVRDVQRRYLAEWREVLRTLQPERPLQDHTTRAFAVIGLINSTAYSRARTASPDEQVSAVLKEMARLALDIPPSRKATP